MLKNKNKKKKGFTLIELVIVLAVLAIIALIAIPNFTKVRNNSKISADVRTGEQIEKITHMAIADEIVPIAAGTYTVVAGGATTGGASGAKLAELGELLREVKAPQVTGGTSYKIDVTAQGDISVGYTGTPTLKGARPWLAGPKASEASNKPVGDSTPEVIPPKNGNPAE